MSHVHEMTEKSEPSTPGVKKLPPPLAPKPKIYRRPSNSINSTNVTSTHTQIQRAFAGDAASPDTEPPNSSKSGNDIALSASPPSSMYQAQCSDKPAVTERRRKVDSDENWDLPSGVKGFANQINEESKMIVEKLKEHNELSQMDLTPLKNDYDTKYRRLTLGKSVKYMERKANAKERQFYNAVSLETVHQLPNDQISTTVLLVGGPGAGKTTTAIKYTNRAIRGEIFGPSDVKVIVFIEGTNILWNSKCRPFDLLFNDQFANIFRSTKASKPLETWIAENPSQVLVVIDGIDVAKGDLNAPAKITLDKRVHPISIIMNLLRRDIYRGMWVMCTTTPQWLWKSTYVMDVQVVDVEGFDKNDVLDILVQLTGERQRVGLLLHCSPAIKDMCKTPAMLIHLASQIKANETMTDIKILLDAIDFFDSHHSGGKKTEHKNMKFVMAVAHQAATTRKDDLEIQDSDREIVYEMGHYISVTYDPEDGKFLGNKPQSHHYRYRFISIAMRDILAAFHWLSMDNNKSYKNLQEELSSPDIPNFILLGVAIIADEDKWRVVTSLSKTREAKLRSLQEVLLKFLESKNRSSTITDVKDLRILRQCAPLLKRNVITKVTAIKMKADCDAADVITVAQSIKSIDKVKTYSSMTIYSSSLALLEENVAMKIANLKIAGDMHEDGERLSKLIEASSRSEDAGSIKFKMGSVELSDYDMKYDVAGNLLEVEELTESKISVINDLFHFTSGRATIEAKTVNMATLSKQRVRSLLEKITKMPEDANNCVLKVGELTCPVQTHTPIEIKNLMTNTSSIQVDVLKYGDVTFLPQSPSTDNANNTSCLITDEVLTASSSLVSLVQSGVWNEVRTREFNIYVEFNAYGDNQRYPAFLRVQRSFRRDRDREAYDQIVPFMIKLGCETLEFSDMKLTAQYICENEGKNVDEITLSRITSIHGSQAYQYLRVDSGTQYSEILKSLFQRSDARLIVIESLKFQRNCSDEYSIAKEWKYKVLNLQYDDFEFLEDLQSLLKTPPIRVERCSLNLSVISSLQKLASNISQIDELHLFVENVGELVDLHQLIDGIKWSNLTVHRGSLHIVIDKNQRGNIAIPEMTVDQFGRLYESLLPLLNKKSIFRVERLVLPRDHHDKYKKVLERFTNVPDNRKAVTLQVNELAVHGIFIHSFQLSLMNESRYFIVSKIQSHDGTKIKFEHDQNNTVQKISISRLSVKSLLDIYDRTKQLNRTEGDRPHWIICIEICYFELCEMNEQAEKLKTELTGNAMISNISSLQVPAIFDAELFQGYDKLLLSGHIGEMVYQGVQQDDFEFRTGRCSGEHNEGLYAKIDCITVAALKSVLDTLAVFCPKVVEVEQCQIEASRDDVREKLSGMTDEYMHKVLMDATLAAIRKKTTEQIDALHDITLRYKDLRIKALAVHGTREDIEAIANDLMTGNDDSNYLSQVSNVALDILALENHPLIAKVLNSGVGLEANCLLIDEPEEALGHWKTTMNVIKNNHFKVSSIKTKHTLDYVLQIISEISTIVEPKTIVAEDAKLMIVDNPGNEKKQLVVVKGNVKSDSIRALSGSLQMTATTTRVYENEQYIETSYLPPSRPPRPRRVQRRSGLNYKNRRRPLPSLPTKSPRSSVSEDLYEDMHSPSSTYPTPTEFQRTYGSESSEEVYDEVDDHIYCN